MYIRAEMSRRFVYIIIRGCFRQNITGNLGSVVSTFMPVTTPWLAYLKPNPYARVRLFCFSYAGGSASVYRRWHWPEALDVCPVQLPGRETRLMEKPLTRMDKLSALLVGALEPYLDMPFAFFGHSLGAVVSYEVAQRLRMARADRLPGHLLVSARRAPQILLRQEPLYHLPDEAFKNGLKQLKGTPQAVLENAELMELMLPALRADFELDETYRHRVDDLPLDCPLTAFGGMEDVDVPRVELEAWRDVTRSRFRLKLFRGDHFFLHRESEALSAAIAEALLE